MEYSDEKEAVVGVSSGSGSSIPKTLTTSDSDKEAVVGGSSGSGSSIPKTLTTSDSGKEAVVGSSSGSRSSIPKTLTATDSDKEATPIAPKEKIVIPDNAHDAPQLDQRHDGSLEVASPVVDGGTGDDEEKRSKPARSLRLCGMPRRRAYWVFAIVGILAVAVILGASLATTVGKGSGGSSTTYTVEVPNVSTEPYTAGITISTSLPTYTVDSSSSDIGNYSCPESNGTTYQTSYFNTANYGYFYFLQLCGIDWPKGSALRNPTTNSSTVVDLSIVLAESLEQCMNQCALYSVENNLGCMAVTYEANKTFAQERDGVGGNCWLKNGPGRDDEQVDNVGDGRMIQAAFVNQMTG